MKGGGQCKADPPGTVGLRGHTPVPWPLPLASGCRRKSTALLILPEALDLAGAARRGHCPTGAIPGTRPRPKPTAWPFLQPDGRSQALDWLPPAQHGMNSRAWCFPEGPWTYPTCTVSPFVPREASPLPCQLSLEGFTGSRALGRLVGMQAGVPISPHACPAAAVFAPGSHQPPGPSGVWGGDGVHLSSRTRSGCLLQGTL